MPGYKTAFVLPPFLLEYPQSPFGHMPGFHGLLNQYLQKASVLDPALAEFDFSDNDFLDDELRSQYMAYVMACATGDYLTEKVGGADVYAGYSMGLYAALYLSGAVTFEEGLQIISYAYDNIRKILPGKDFLMAGITGLSREDLEELSVDLTSRPKISIQNSQYSFTVSGKTDDIIAFLDAAKKEGALNTKVMNVSIPYHSAFLKGITELLCRDLSSIHFRKPQVALISLVDQNMINSVDDIMAEITRNIFTPLNWYRTQLFLQDSGVKTFVECGPGKSLVKNSRFIEGDAIFLNADSFFAQNSSHEQG